MFYRKERQAWNDMIRRCERPENSNYHLYGAKGIKVCDNWHDFDSFFFDVGQAPGPEYSVDRWPNKKGNYEPGNVRWATSPQQQRNKENNLIVPWKGEEILAIDLAVILGKDPLPYARRIWQRIYRQNYTPEEAVMDETDGRSGLRRTENSTLVQIDGGPVISLQEASRLQNLEYSTVNQRRYRGASLAEALGLVGRLAVLQEVTRPRKKKG